MFDEFEQFGSEPGPGSVAPDLAGHLDDQSQLVVLQLGGHSPTRTKTK